MDKKIINIHDRFFKSLFSRKDEVKEFISKTLDVSVVERLNLNSLELDSTEYFDSELHSSYSDLVYNCKYGKNSTVKISMLFEHKSYPEKYPHLQLLAYMLRIWEKQINQNQDLTQIIPIIFYHGKTEWKQETFENNFKNIDEGLMDFLPSFNYELVDTSKYTNKEFEEHFESIQLQVGLLVLKNIFHEQKFMELSNIIFDKLNQLEQNEQSIRFSDSIFAYILNTTSINTDKFIQNMENIAQPAEKQFISTATRLQNIGKIEGEKIANRKTAMKLIIKGSSNIEIMELTNLSEIEIEGLRDLRKLSE